MLQSELNFMIGTIRKHQNWLWAVIITGIIISFVIYFSPYSKMNGSRRASNLGSINGQSITEEDYMNAARESLLRYFFNNGRFPEDNTKSGFDEQRETYQWLLIVQKLDEYQVHPDSVDVAQFGRNMLNRLDRSGHNVDPKMVETRIFQPRGLSLADFERFCRHSLGLQQLIAVVGTGGELVTPQEARAVYERQYQEVSSEAVFLNLSNYLSSVTVTPEALHEFYTNRMAFYRIPERVSVRYVEFPLTNFTAQAEAALKTNLTELVEANFESLGTNYTRVAQTPELARAHIREELIRQKATEIAYRKAREFDNALFNMKPVQAENLETLAKASGLKAGVTALFSMKEGPSDLEAGPEFAKAAFSLSPEQPFSNKAQAGTESFYIISFNKRLPSEMPTLAQAHDKVLADYKAYNAFVLANQKALSAYTSLTNSLAQGKSFSSACLQVGLKPTSLPLVSVATKSLPELEERIPLGELQQLVLGTPVGKVSPPQQTQDGAIIVYVRGKMPLDETRLKSDMPGFLKSLRQRCASEAFNVWFMHEAEKGLRDTPLAQPKPASNLGAAPAAKS